LYMAVLWMDVTLTKNGGFFDKGCPGERLITRNWFC